MSHNHPAHARGQPQRKPPQHVQRGLPHSPHRPHGYGQPGMQAVYTAPSGGGFVGCGAGGAGAVVTYTLEEKKRIGQALTRKLGNDKLAQRKGPGGSKVTYLEGWRSTELANEVFGFNGWRCTILSLHLDSMEVKQDSYGKKFICCYSAVVRVTLKDGTHHDDVGVGTADQGSRPASMQKAMKEAVTDARKRALKNFGNLLGLCIYDKAHVKVYKQKETLSYGKDTDAAMDLVPSLPAGAAAPPQKRKADAGKAVAAVAAPNGRQQQQQQQQPQHGLRQQQQQQQHPHLTPVVRPASSSSSSSVGANGASGAEPANKRARAPLAQQLNRQPPAAVIVQPQQQQQQPAARSDRFSSQEDDGHVIDDMDMDLDDW